MLSQPNLQQIGELEPSTKIWRYLPFYRFVSLITIGGLWFSKLQNFSDDPLEGLVPEPARGNLKSQHRDMENWFEDEDRKQQVRRFVEDNEESGRELIVANCWFINEHESDEMWTQYAKDKEGVVIQSTAQDLAQSLTMSHHGWWIGKMNYVDFMSHDGMNAYEGHQAHLRAFVKNQKYSHENELRIATMNWVTPGCLNPDGQPPNEKQQQGLVYSPGRPGIYVKTHLPHLVREIRTAPGASDWHHSRVDLLRRTAGIAVPTLRSEQAPSAYRGV